MDQDLEAKIAIRYRTLMTLWAALAMTIVLYFIFARFLMSRNPGTAPNSTLSVILMAAGVLCVLCSLIAKRKFLQRAAAEQNPAAVQSGYVIAWAVNEVAAVLGILDYLLAADRFYYVLFILAGAGILLHMPRRSDLLAASYKRGV